MAEKSYHTPKVKGSSREELPTSTEWLLHGCRRAERSYSMFKVRRGACWRSHKEIPMSKVRETQVRCEVL